MLRWAERLEVPLSIQHGWQDRLNSTPALRLAMRLQELNSPYQLIVLTRHREQRDRAVVEWFRAYR